MIWGEIGVVALFALYANHSYVQGCYDTRYRRPQWALQCDVIRTIIIAVPMCASLLFRFVMADLVSLELGETCK